MESRLDLAWLDHQKRKVKKIEYILPGYLLVRNFKFLFLFLYLHLHLHLHTSAFLHFLNVWNHKAIVIPYHMTFEDSGRKDEGGNE